MGYCRDGLQVGDFELGIGKNLHKHTAGVPVNGTVDSLQVGEVAQAGLDAKAQQGVGQQGQRIAEEVVRRHDVLALCGNGQQGVADGCHPRIEGRHVGSTRKRTDALLQIGDGGVLHPGIVGGLDAATLL